MECPVPIADTGSLDEIGIAVLVREAGIEQGVFVIIMIERIGLLIRFIPCHRWSIVQLHYTIVSQGLSQGEISG